MGEGLARVYGEGQKNEKIKKNKKKIETTELRKTCGIIITRMHT